MVYILAFVPTKVEYEQCVCAFPYLFEEWEGKKHIPDDEFKTLGFPIDIGMNGHEVKRSKN